MLSADTISALSHIIKDYSLPKTVLNLDGSTVPSRALGFDNPLGVTCFNPDNVPLKALKDQTMAPLRRQILMAALKISDMMTIS